MQDFSITKPIVLTMAIMEYKDRHQGRKPARVFVSEEMYAELVKEDVKVVRYRDEKPCDKFCGVPLVRYGSTGAAEFYLSDKEAI